MHASRRCLDFAASAGAIGLCAVCVAACSPTLDWRENVAPGSGLMTSFPCHPDRHLRQVELAGRRVDMQMLVCTAGDATYAVSFYDASDPAQVDSGLSALRAALLANLADAHPRVEAARVSGMTPSARAVQLLAHGRRPDGRPIELRAAVFSRGLRVYQAAVVGSALADDAVEPFFAGLRLSDRPGAP